MKEFKRYAIYYAPPEGEFARRAAHWLGWDPARGIERPHPQADPAGVEVAAITRDPRKYGFHGTLKAPFRLAEGVTSADLSAAVAELASHLAPVTLPGLALRRLGGFLALTPQGNDAALVALAADCVRALDRFRAPLSTQEIARRRPERLSPRQRDLLDLWGYPYVMEEFRFHLTLTDKLPEDTAEAIRPWLAAYFAPVLPEPFEMNEICLFAEATDGRFHLVERFRLGG